MSDATPLRAFRKAQADKMTLKMLAEQLQMSEGQLSRIERHGTHSLATALKIAKVTKLPVEALLSPKAAA